MENASLLTVAQASHRSGISESAIRAAMHRGNLPHEDFYGRILIKAEDIEAYKATVKMGRPPKASKVSKEGE